MGWIRISDDFYDNEKIGAAGPLGLALWAASLGYCNRNLTDGLIPKAKIPGLIDFSELPDYDGHDWSRYTIDSLLHVGLWHEDRHDCANCPQPGRRHYVVHDYLNFQRSKEWIANKAETDRRRVEAWRASRNDVSNGVTNDVRNDVRTNVPTPTPTPTPTTKDPSVALVGGSGGKEPSSARGTRLPDGWQPAPDVVARMRSDHPHVNLNAELDKFRDHWRAQSGARGRKADWNATYRNWIRRAAEQTPRASPNGARPSTTDALIAQTQALKTRFHHNPPLELP